MLGLSFKVRTEVPRGFEMGSARFRFLVRAYPSGWRWGGMRFPGSILIWAGPLSIHLEDRRAVAAAIARG